MSSPVLFQLAAALSLGADLAAPGVRVERVVDDEDGKVKFVCLKWNELTEDDDLVNVREWRDEPGALGPMIRRDVLTLDFSAFGAAKAFLEHTGEDAARAAIKTSEGHQCSETSEDAGHVRARVEGEHATSLPADAPQSRFFDFGGSSSAGSHFEGIWTPLAGGGLRRAGYGRRAGRGHLHPDERREGLRRPGPVNGANVVTPRRDGGSSCAHVWARRPDLDRGHELLFVCSTCDELGHKAFGSKAEPRAYSRRQRLETTEKQFDARRAERALGTGAYIQSHGSVWFERRTA